MVSIARKNFFHDRVRLMVTITGITFAVVLIFAQVGIYLGFMRNASMIIDVADADIWVTSKNLKNFEWARPIPTQRLQQVREVKGVAVAEALIMTWSIMKLADGGQEQIQIIGYNPVSGRGGPLDMLEGRAVDVKGGPYVIVDESSASKIGALRVGDDREILNTKMRVVGICRGTRSFSTAPYVFMDYQTAQEVGRVMLNGDPSFVLVKVQPGEPVDAVVERIRAHAPFVEVMTREAFSFRTRWYWTVSTGMGMGFLITAFMGIVVGIVVVGQTIYASTSEHLREFGTLKAIGASNGYLYRIIMEQALISAVWGYVQSVGIVMLMREGYEKVGISMVVPPLLLVWVLGLTVAMCLLAAVLSIRKVTVLDPVMVFRA